MNKRFKDYNIVSNKYLEHHDTKVRTDEEVQKAEAAKKYWNTHNFDPLIWLLTGVPNYLAVHWLFPPPPFVCCGGEAAMTKDQKAR